MTHANVMRSTLCAVAVLAAGTPAFGQANSGETSRQAVPVAPPAAASVQGFSVVLVLGSLKDSAETFAGELPRGAQRALADMTDFLPYRSYRLLDSAWILNPASGRATSRMQGVENRQYEVSLDSSTIPPSNLTVKFTLREGGGNREPTARTPFTAQELEAVFQNEAAHLTSVIPMLEAELAALVRKLGVGLAAHPDVMRKKAQIDEAKHRMEMLKAGQNRASSEGAAPGSGIIDTGFTMNVGETVVVGTSRLQGDTALIVLLTAVPRGSK